MAKKKTPHLVISDIKRYREISRIHSIVNNVYNGRMPKSIYKGFLNVISNPEIKDLFVRFFKPSSYTPAPLAINTPKGNKKRKKKQSGTDISNPPNKTIDTNSSTPSNNNETPIQYQPIYTVRATDFSYGHTTHGPCIVYKSHKALGFVRSEWFQPRILKAIYRTFQIQLDDYLGFRFIPHSDKQIFLDLIEQTYLDIEQQIYKEELSSCLNLIGNFLANCIDNYIYKCQHLKLDTNLDDYSFNESKQVYIYKFNAMEYLDISNEKVRLSVPLNWILEQLDEADFNKFQREITSKYPDGFHRIIELEKIFPNLTSFDVTVVIPRIFINRFGKDKPIEIIALYNPDLGKFESGVSSNIPGYHYNTETSDVVFSDKVKESLIKIIRNIDSKFVITFYTAFIKMFNEGDSIIWRDRSMLGQHGRHKTVPKSAF